MTLYALEHRLGDVGAGHLAALRDAAREITRRLDGVATDGGTTRNLRAR